MQRFTCEHCGSEVPFDASSCATCSTLLGYVPDERTVRRLIPAGNESAYTTTGAQTERWRCLNAAWGCNWTLPTGAGPWCRSCSLTRGRPDHGRPDAIAAWSVAEAAKRRLVHQLDGLGLPVQPRSTTAPDGLVFDLVHLPGERGLTGHLDGVVTIDLAEADPVHRDELRRRLGEPFRTILGSLRHEVAHHYWPRLVDDAELLTEFRVLFGDERADYRAALQTYYAPGTPTWDDRWFITRYAQSHPHEDWAETFAHYLHLTDLVDTAIAHGLIAASGPDDALPVPRAASMRRVLDVWSPIANAIDALADTVGADHLYPIAPRDGVVEKLAFIHARVTARSPITAHN